jgi:pilus assembly protein FimV
LAYGRDLQAEEILKEALRSHPSRSVVHAKLMEIYAKRRDVKAFEAIAKEAFKLTQGEGADWQAAAERGRQIDPSNPLYVQRSASQLSGTSAVAKAAAQDNTEITSAQRSSFEDSQAFDLDFDLDLSADSPTPARAQSSVIASLQESRPGKSANAALDESPRVSFGKDLNFSSPPSASSTPFTAPTAPTAPMALKLAPSEHAALGLEMREISLDLSDPSNNVDSKSAQLSSTDNHMETKLSLAIELRSIGDVDGARSLIQEVIDEATGPTKARALKMRSELG